MKRIIFSMLILCGAFVSCDKENTPVASPQEYQTVDISFAAEGEYELTRGYFDGGTTPETWEKTLNSVEIFVCQGGNLYLRRSLTPEELGAKKVTLAIPSVHNSDWVVYPVRLYFIANHITQTEVNNMLALETLIDDLPVLYNCSGDADSPGPKWETGFTMSARHELKGRTPDDLNINITLKRIVSKIAVKVSVDPDFTTNHQGGKLEITGASVVRTAKDCRIIKPTPYEIGTTMDFAHRIGAVKSEIDKEFVFYIFPNERINYFGQVDPKSPAIIIEGIFDRDGNPATTDDLFDIQYEVFINEAEGSLVTRNQVYKYDLKVIGLDGAQVESTFSIKDWVSPDTQVVEAGN